MWIVFFLQWKIAKQDQIKKSTQSRKWRLNTRLTKYLDGISQKSGLHPKTGPGAKGVQSNIFKEIYQAASTFFQQKDISQPTWQEKISSIYSSPGHPQQEKHWRSPFQGLHYKSSCGVLEDSLPKAVDTSRWKEGETAILMLFAPFEWKTAPTAEIWWPRGKWQPLSQSNLELSACCMLKGIRDWTRTESCRTAPGATCWLWIAVGVTNGSSASENPFHG